MKTQVTAREPINASLHPTVRGPRLLGPSKHSRYVVRDNRRHADHFWTGRGFSRRLTDARLFVDPDDAARTASLLTRGHLRRHEPERLYLLTLVVRVHAPEDISRQDVEKYLKGALFVGVDHRRYDTGPTEGSLVEVLVPVIRLEEGR